MKREECRQEATLMRVTSGGAYVMVQKFGIEGILNVDDELKKRGIKVQANPDKEEAVIVDDSEGESK